MERPFVVDPVLSGIAVGYSNDASSYIADDVLPRRSVGGEKFKWSEYPIEEAFNVPDSRVGRTGQPQQLEFTGTEKTASVEDFGFDVPIPNSDIDAARNAREQGLSNFDPEANAVMRAADTMSNIREVRVAGLVHNPNSYAPNRKVALLGDSRFDSTAGKSNPIGVIKGGMDATLVKRPNTIVMGRRPWSVLSAHTSIVNAVKGNVTSQGIVSREQFLELFSGEGITRVLVGDAWFNTARPGQAARLQRAWGNHIALLHLDPLATPESGGITFGLTAQYGTKISGRIEDPDIGLQGGFRIRTGERVKELIVARDVGFLIQDAVGDPA